MTRRLVSPTETVSARVSLLRILGLLLLGFVVAGCAASPSASVVDFDDASAAAIAEAIAGPSELDPDPTATAESADAVPTPPETSLEPTPEPTALYDFGDTALPNAPIGVEGLTPGPVGRSPVSLEIEDIDVVDAAVIPVGVNPDQTFEVPPADQVGWYRFGPAPGDEGSAVLAAHIAFDGVDGVFRRLADAEVGSIVAVVFDDGSRQRYRIESVTDYDKQELPSELFARSGDSQLALITCGGTFNPQLRSYESNTVAVAVPI